MRDDPPTKAEFIRALKRLGVTGEEPVENREDVQKLVLTRYRKLAFELHPDRGGDPALFHQVTAAKETALRFIATHQLRPRASYDYRNATIYVNGQAVGRVSVSFGGDVG